MAGKNRDKTALTSPHGLFRFTRLILVQSHRGTSQVTMDVLQTNVKWQFALAYLYYIELFSQTTDDHIDFSRQIWNVLNKTGVTMMLSHSVFFKKHVDYLRYFIWPGWQELSTWKIDGISGLNYQINLTENSSFLGLCTVLCWFLLSIARLAARRPGSL